MPMPIELLKRLQEAGGLNDVLMGALPIAPMGAEPPEYFSDVENAGLALAPMAAGGTVEGSLPANPAMRIAIALEEVRRQGRR